MNPQIDSIKKTRNYLIDLVNDLSAEQLNEIPANFNNNIIWHLGHMIASQQGICYLRAGVAPAVDEKYMLAYKPGTKPEAFIDTGEINKIKALLIQSLDVLEENYQNNLFSNYVSWTSRYGTTLTNIDDVLQFLLYHEGLHAGFVTALKRLVKK